MERFLSITRAYLRTPLSDVSINIQFAEAMQPELHRPLDDRCLACARRGNTSYGTDSESKRVGDNASQAGSRQALS